MQQPLMVQHGVKVSMDYELTVDGEVIDASKPGEPLQFVQGRHQIIPGLETELIDMMVGESKEVIVNPAQGYGEYNPQYNITIPRNRLPPNIPYQAGVTLQIPGPNGQTVPARVLDFTDETVHLDFNHPLAGKTLHFKITIAALSQ
jgi:FKBP-type peptidyl-prolyl cis-trans isomerase SlyD